ncbi:ABC transporter ATP-binding protein [Oceanobacillus kapialis]|uniref:ABC transporter ATP-binding protein n=1 Tax=Oceanobacillus kapialis TaxID=481353 RepID=A0ABW5PZ35_9BACI
MSDNLLEVKNLHTHFFTENGVIPSVNGVSFSVKKGEIIGIVGESGCGKSVTSLSILQLINKPGKIVDGEIRFHDQDLTTFSEKEIRKIRGNKISMIFQEPLTSLNPVFTIGHQISEAIRLHQDVDKKEAKQRSISLLRKVGMANPERQYHAFPHLLSGGMRQRVMIAMALSCNPELLIADEPTTALDVTIQKQILKLMKNLSNELNTSIILITHDLGVIAEMVDRVVVMYGGEIVEENDVFNLFKNPKHPYTKGLLNSTPKIHQLKEKLQSIDGNVPTPDQLPTGCNFQDRCPFAMEKCREQSPNLVTSENGSSVRCWLHQEKEVVNV